MKARKLTASQFKQASALLPRVTQQNKGMARRVLVDGETFRAVADSSGCHPSNVSKAVKKVYDAFLDQIMGCPAGWYHESVCLPTKKAVSEVRRIEREALREFKRGS